MSISDVDTTEVKLSYCSLTFVGFYVTIGLLLTATFAVKTRTLTQERVDVTLKRMATGALAALIFIGVLIYGDALVTIEWPNIVMENYSLTFVDEQNNPSQCDGSLLDGEGQKVADVATDGDGVIKGWRTGKFVVKVDCQRVRWTIPIDTLVGVALMWDPAGNPHFANGATFSDALESRRVVPTPTPYPPGVATPTPIGIKTHQHCSCLPPSRAVGTPEFPPALVPTPTPYPPGVATPTPLGGPVIMYMTPVPATPGVAAETPVA